MSCCSLSSTFLKAEKPVSRVIFLLEKRAAQINVINFMRELQNVTLIIKKSQRLRHLIDLSTFCYFNNAPEENYWFLIGKCGS